MIERIEREAGLTNLLTALGERLSLTDLQSLLLEVYRSHAATLPASSLLDRYLSNRFVKPSDLDPLTLVKFDQMALSLLPDGFIAVELSPVCPLGTVTAITGLDQSSVLTTIRNTEVVADATNVLALECAVRRRKLLATDARSRGLVKLASSHRVVRTVPARGAATYQHFRLLGLCSAGRDSGSFGFESESLLEQITFYLDLLAEAPRRGYEVGATRVTVTELEDGRRPKLRAGVLAPLRDRFPTVQCDFDPERTSGRGYYTGACFHVFARDPAGTELQLVDGGFTDWTQTLLANAKERLLISGMGGERFVARFRRAQPAW